MDKNTEYRYVLADNEYRDSCVGETDHSDYNVNDAPFINNIWLSATVPEPDSSGLLSLGAFGLLGARRRKSAQSNNA